MVVYLFIFILCLRKNSTKFEYNMNTLLLRISNFENINCKKL